jgi:integrase
MNPVLHAEIRALAVARGSITRKGSEHVFLDEDGSRYTENKLDRDRKKAVEACDLIPTEKKPHVTTHTLRHTAASLMVAAGVPIFDVSKILGHSSVVVTMRYAHFAPEAGRKAVDALGRVLDPGGEADEVREATAPGWSLWLRSGVA